MKIWVILNYNNLIIKQTKITFVLLDKQNFIIKTHPSKFNKNSYNLNYMPESVSIPYLLFSWLLFSSLVTPFLCSLFLCYGFPSCNPNSKSKFGSFCAIHQGRDIWWPGCRFHSGNQKNDQKDHGRVEEGWKETFQLFKLQLSPTKNLRYLPSFIVLLVVHQITTECDSIKD